MLPLLIDITEWPVLIIGGGVVALRKAKALAAEGAEITVISPTLCHGWQDLAFCHIAESWQGEIPKGCRMVVAATDDSELNTQIARQCQKLGILCNTASHPQSGDFIFPGTVRQNGLTACISTEGQAPFLSKKLKADLMTILAQYDEATVNLLGETRAYIIENYPAEKERLLRLLANMPPHLVKEKGNKYDITHWLQGEQAGANTD